MVWAPTGAETIQFVKDLRDYYTRASKVVHPRLAALARQATGSSAGALTDVALTVIREAGRDPREVFG